MRRCSGRMTKPPAYPFRYLAMSNSRGTKQTAVANPTWRQQPVRPEFPVAPSPRQEPYLAIPLPTVKNLLDNLPRRQPGPPGSASRLPRPSQRPRRSVKRYLGGRIEEGKHKKSPKPQVQCKWLKDSNFLAPPRRIEGLRQGVRPFPQPNLSPFRNAWMTESVARVIQLIRDPAGRTQRKRKRARLMPRP